MMRPWTHTTTWRINRATNGRWTFLIILWPFGALHDHRPATTIWFGPLTLYRRLAP